MLINKYVRRLTTGIPSEKCVVRRFRRKRNVSNVCLSVCLLSDSPPLPVGQGLLIHEVSRSHTKTHHSRHDSSGRVISSSQRPLPDNTQHSQQTDIHAPGGIRTHNLSRREDADLRLRPRGHWDRHLMYVLFRKFTFGWCD